MPHLKDRRTQRANRPSLDAANHRRALHQHRSPSQGTTTAKGNTGTLVDNFENGAPTDPNTRFCSSKRRLEPGAQNCVFPAKDVEHVDICLTFFKERPQRDRFPSRLQQWPQETESTSLIVDRQRCHRGSAPTPLIERWDIDGYIFGLAPRKDANVGSNGPPRRTRPCYL